MLHYRDLKERLLAVSHGQNWWRSRYIGTPVRGHRNRFTPSPCATHWNRLVPGFFAKGFPANDQCQPHPPGFRAYFLADETAILDIKMVPALLAQPFRSKIGIYGGRRLIIFNDVKHWIAKV